MNTTLQQNQTTELRFIANMPQALLDYLWSWVTSLDFDKNESAVLELRPVELETGVVQQIRMVRGLHAEDRKMLGCDPITADIQVSGGPDGCVMHLLDWERA